jgi:hypothetical protein
MPPSRILIFCARLMLRTTPNWSQAVTAWRDAQLPGLCAFINGRAPRARSLSSAFLAKGQEYFEAGGGDDIWQIMHDKYLLNISGD